MGFPRPSKTTKLNQSPRSNAPRLLRCLWVGIHGPNRSMDRGLSTRCAAALVVRSLARRVSPATRHGAPGVSLELSESVNFTYAGTVWTATWKLFFEVVLIENLKIEEFCCHHEVAWSFGDINLRSIWTKKYQSRRISDVSLGKKMCCEIMHLYFGQEPSQVHLERKR